MRKKLYFLVLLILMVWLITSSVSGQIIILAEDFSGFTTGSHSTPSTSDASATLDSRTSTPGWNGSMVYSAGGEIKLGTSTTPGWIETPMIDHSVSGGNFIIKFDIARWVGDASTVQVYYNDVEKGAVISPGDSYQTIQLLCTGETVSGKVKIKGLTKRFFLDNFSVVKEGIPTASHDYNYDKGIRIYPVPSSSVLNIESTLLPYTAEVTDITGKTVMATARVEGNKFTIDISGLKDGIYFLKLNDGKISTVKRFIKSGK